MKLGYGRESKRVDSALSSENAPKARWSRWARAGSVLLLCGAARGLLSCGSPQEPSDRDYAGQGPHVQCVTQEPQAQSAAQERHVLGPDELLIRINSLDYLLGDGNERASEDADALVRLISVDGVDSQLRERIYERIYSLLPQSPQEEHWSTYASQLMRISLLEGVGPQYLERTIGLLESAIDVVEENDVGYFNTAAMWLRDTTLSERCDAPNQERIIAFLEGAFSEGGDIRRASIAPQLGLIAGNRTIAPEIRERIIGRLESARSDTEPLIRAYANSALAVAEHAFNREGETDAALRMRVIRALSYSLNDQDSEVRGRAARTIVEYIYAGVIFQEHIDVIVPAVITSPDLGDAGLCFPCRVLDDIIVDNRDIISQQARTTLVGFLGGWLRRDESALRNQAAGYLGIIGASRDTTPEMRQQIIRLLSRTEHDRNESVRATGEAAIRQTEGAEP